MKSNLGKINKSDVTGCHDGSVSNNLQVGTGAKLFDIQPILNSAFTGGGGESLRPGSVVMCP